MGTTGAGIGTWESWGGCTGACCPPFLVPAAHSAKGWEGCVGVCMVLNVLWGHVMSQGTEPSHLARQPWLLIWERAQGADEPVKAGKSLGIAAASHEWRA